MSQANIIVHCPYYKQKYNYGADESICIKHEFSRNFIQIKTLSFSLCQLQLDQELRKVMTEQISSLSALNRTIIVRWYFVDGKKMLRVKQIASSAHDSDDLDKILLVLEDKYKIF